jgi:hypothetical protein
VIVPCLPFRLRKRRDLDSVVAAVPLFWFLSSWSAVAWAATLRAVVAISMHMKCFMIMVVVLLLVGQEEELLLVGLRDYKLILLAEDPKNEGRMVKL